jgi:hypothetical protein
MSIKVAFCAGRRWADFQIGGELQIRPTGLAADWWLGMASAHLMLDAGN